jgi:GT2 family glycosyltransferase
MIMKETNSLGNLAIIILNYNTAGKIANQVTQLIAEGISSSIFYIIDNHSKIEDRKSLEDFSQKNNLNFIKSPENGGYAKGNNIAIAHAINDGKIVFLILNPDIEIPLKTISTLYETISNEKELLFVGPRICDKYDRNIIFSDGGILKPEKCFESDHLHYGRNVEEVNSSEKNYRIDYVNGSALMFKKETVEILGKMREDFFMYFEEAEWCYRLKQYPKYKQAILTNVVAYHEMSDKGNFYQFYMTRNRIFMCRLYQIPHNALIKNYLYEAQKRFLGFKGNTKKNFSFFTTQVRAVLEGEFRKLNS